MSLSDATAICMVVITSAASARMLLGAYFNAKARALRDASGLGSLLSAFASPAPAQAQGTAPKLPEPTPFPPPTTETSKS